MAAGGPQLARSKTRNRSHPRTSQAWVEPLIQPLAQLEHDENGEVVLDLCISLDLINRTEFCQGRDVSLTDGSCAVISGSSDAVILGATRHSRRQEGFR